MDHPAYRVLLQHLDVWAAGLLLPLTVWLFFNGLDDLFVDAVMLVARLRQGPAPATPVLPGGIDHQKRIAIFVPLWHEHAVIGRMLTQNLGAIHYQEYDFFVGAYPNDDLTLDAIRDVEARQPRVHLALCPHDGPTSKADCLNWIYQRMILYEEEHGCRFEIVVTHDAEDLIHPQALHQINHHSREYDMVQVPVLALSTPALEMVHGVYCDEFAEFQLRDQLARLAMGSFLPSNGVGTGYTRRALEALAESSHNQIFDPASLTEDYENGIRLYELGCRQIFLPLVPHPDGFIATREYFPQSFHTAVRQRTRWVTGIALQGWQRRGWRGPLPQVYWYWRDRKGLLGYPVTVLANLLFLYGVLSAAVSWATGQVWLFSEEVGQQWALLCVNLGLQLLRVTFRFHYVRQIYGWRFALLSPVRTLVGNVINSKASITAVYRFAYARWTGQALAWSKTSHSYPNRIVLQKHSRKVGELLVSRGYLPQHLLDEALATQPVGCRLGDYLLQSGLISEEGLYAALSEQQGWPLEPLDETEVEPACVRSLPRALSKRWRILPFQVRAGHLHVAGPDLPTPELQAELQRHTGLAIHFRWITPSNFLRLSSRLM